MNVFRRTWTLSVACLAAGLLAACGPTGSSDAGPAGDAGEQSGDSEADVYEAGLAKEGDAVTVRLVSAEPAPPDRGDNTWVVEVLQDGAPLGDAAVELEPWMPAHGHGTTPASYEGRPVDGEPGHYEFGPFDLFMPGQWELNVLVEDGELADQVQYVFDIEG